MIASNGVLRVAGGASSVLVGVYVADLARRGFDVGAALVGVLAAIAFGAELVGAVPLGLLADAVPTRMLMTGGALLAAFATVLFGLTHDVGVLLVSRALEGLAAAAGVPALLGVGAMGSTPRSGGRGIAVTSAPRVEPVFAVITPVA